MALRFPLHGFQRIRRYDLLASRTKQNHVTRCHASLGQPAPTPPVKKTTAEWQVLLLSVGIKGDEAVHSAEWAFAHFTGGVLGTDFRSAVAFTDTEKTAPQFSAWALAEYASLTGVCLSLGAPSRGLRFIFEWHESNRLFNLLMTDFVWKIRRFGIGTYCGRHEKGRVALTTANPLTPEFFGNQTTFATARANDSN